MVRIINIAIVFFLMGNTLAQKKITSIFKENWKTSIGLTTYRTNMIFHEGLIYIGSNGKDRTGRLDDQDGVYAIDPKTGKIVHQFVLPFGGDNDVTGIAIGDGKLFFGTDNYYFFCFDLKTHEELWKYNLPFDVESKPVLEDFNNDQKLDVFFSVQNAGFYALDGTNGSLIWKNEIITSHEGNVAALAVDVNNDGVKDLITAGRGTANSDEIQGFKMKHYGDYHLALNGKTGDFIWVVETGGGVHSSPFMVKSDGQTLFYLMDSYGQLSIVDSKGKRLRQVDFGFDYFMSPIVSKDGFLILGSESTPIGKAFWMTENDTLPQYLSDKAITKNVDVFGARISATTMIADVLGKGFPQLVGVTEMGDLFLAKTDGTEIQQVKFNEGAETSVFIKDIDQDGKLEILIASLDGNLYCYKTNSSGKVEVGIF